MSLLGVTALGLLGDGGLNIFSGEDEAKFDAEFTAKLNEYSSGVKPENDSTFGDIFRGKMVDFENKYGVDIIYGGGILQKNTGIVGPTSVNQPQETNVPSYDNSPTGTIPPEINWPLYIGLGAAAIVAYFIFKKKSKR